MTSFLIRNTIFMSYWAIRHKETCLILATLRIERPNNFQTPKTLFEHLDRWSCMSWNPATGLICTCSHSVLGSSWKTLSCLKFCCCLHPLRRNFPDYCSQFWDGSGESYKKYFFPSRRKDYEKFSPYFSLSEVENFLKLHLFGKNCQN